MGSGNSILFALRCTARPVGPPRGSCPAAAMSAAPVTTEGSAMLPQSPVPDGSPGHVFPGDQEGRFAVLTVAVWASVAWH